jgi:FlaA1/EpsC-like NDP-sugar epimerase/dTDP-4-amino-4,6-dideoxygalactose transaminase
LQLGRFSTPRTDRRVPAPHQAIARTVYGVARGRGTTSLRVLDVGVVAIAWLVALLAGFEGRIPFGIRGALPYLVIPVVVQLTVNQLIGLYGPVWRYASVDEALRVFVAGALGTVAATFGLAWVAVLRDNTLPLLSAPPIAALLILIGCGGIRFQARLFALERQRVGGAKGTRTAIIGAGDAGVALALELNGRPNGDAAVVGFFDDDPQLIGRSLRGIEVLGSTHDLERVCEDKSINRLLIAIPGASREQLRDIVERALKTDAQVKVLSEGTDPLGDVLLKNLRELDLADLLGREHAPVDPTDIGDYIGGAVVLVTGAGGSIGSEIARQVLRYGPAKLVLLDRDESLLFETVTSLGQADAVLADIRDPARLREVFAKHRPEVVFHAAAHKHVPILETHAVEAVQTNVLGTYSLACICAEYGSRLVHISTDKAAAPCSVMGASKRAAEIVVMGVGADRQLPFAAVRFGNVLGSRGSVVPTFFRQIVAGGPVTVTDPEMTRYFMTIQEAVSLVLQAGAMAHERKVFVLDMGKPVKIIDLARQMIRLAGYRAGEDIEIKIVGTRPGERLHEQLDDDAEFSAPTWHPSISGLTSKVAADRHTVNCFLDLLARHCAEATDPIVARLLQEMLTECGISCRLTAASDPAAEIVARPAHLPAPVVSTSAEIIDLTSPAVVRGTPTSVVPALLGGTPAFAHGLPFARPARPPIEDVMRRLEPSYECGMLTNGPLVAELEDRLAERIGVRNVVAVSSCTSGMMLVLQALTEGRGRVVMPSFTFSATAHAAAWNNCTPDFVDCSAETFQMDLASAASRLEGAAALVATHVFGAPCDPRTVMELAQAFDVPVLFDAAHALGAVAGGSPVGGFGAAEVFSLTPTKVLVAGEGGLVTTNDDALAERIRIGRDYGNPGNYDTQFVGLNARMSEFHAAMALESLRKFAGSLERRRYLAALYRTYLEEIPGIGFQEVPTGDVSTYKDFTITVDADRFGLSRDLLAHSLKAEGIDTRKYFDPPVHRQFAYSHLAPEPLPTTDAVAGSVLSLPMFPDLRNEHVERVADRIAALQTHAVEIDASAESEASAANSRMLRFG